MRRILVLPLAVLVLGGCVVRYRTPPVAYVPPPEVAYAPPPEVAYAPPPQAAPLSVAYYGEHALPGGGWCYLDGRT